jgi:uncharacterized OB-fold protein
MAKLEDYVPIDSVGIVESYTTCTQDNEGKPLPQPVGVALVRFPRAHGGLVHKTKGEVSVGDKVRVVFKEKSKRTGSILDIEYFEKIA